MARTWTSSQPSSPHWSRICLVACTIRGTVAYSYLGMGMGASIAATASCRNAGPGTARHDGPMSDLPEAVGRPAPDVTVTYGPLPEHVADVRWPSTRSLGGHRPVPLV